MIITTRAQRMRAVAALLRNHLERLPSSSFDVQLHNTSVVPQLLDVLTTASVSDVAQVSGLDTAWVHRVLHAANIVSRYFARRESDGVMVIRGRRVAPALRTLKAFGVIR